MRLVKLRLFYTSILRLILKRGVGMCLNLLCLRLIRIIKWLMILRYLRARSLDTRRSLYTFFTDGRRLRRALVVRLK